MKNAQEATGVAEELAEVRRRHREERRTRRRFVQEFPGCCPLCAERGLVRDPAGLPGVLYCLACERLVRKSLVGARLAWSAWLVCVQLWTLPRSEQEFDLWDVEAFGLLLTSILLVVASTAFAHFRLVARRPVEEVIDRGQRVVAPWRAVLPTAAILVVVVALVAAQVRLRERPEQPWQPERRLEGGQAQLSEAGNVLVAVSDQRFRWGSWRTSGPWGKVLAWRLADDIELLYEVTLPPNEEVTGAPSVSRDGTLLAYVIVAGGKARLEVIDLLGGEKTVVSLPSIDDERVDRIALEDWIEVWSWPSNSILRFDLETGERLADLPPEQSSRLRPATEVSSPDGRYRVQREYPMEILVGGVRVAQLGALDLVGFLDGGKRLVAEDGLDTLVLRQVRPMSAWGILGERAWGLLVALSVILGWLLPNAIHGRRLVDHPGDVQ